MVQLVPTVFQIFTKSWKNVSDAFLAPGFGGGWPLPVVIDRM